MKKYLLGFILMMSFGLTSIQAQPESESNDTTIAISVGGDKEVIFKNIDKDTRLEDLGEVFESIVNHIEPVVENDEFPPKTTAGWIALVLALGGIFTKLITDIKKGASLVKDIFSEFDTRTFVLGTGMVLSLLYQLWAAKWNIFGVEWLEWVGMGLAFSSIGMIIHEIIGSVRALFNKKEIAEVSA